MQCTLAFAVAYVGRACSPQRAFDGTIAYWFLILLEPRLALLLLAPETYETGRMMSSGSWLR